MSTVKKMTFSKNAKKSCPVFQNIFSELTDPRRTDKGNFYYPFNEILFLTISAVISGMNNWTSISNFGDYKLDWLRKYFPFVNGVPSHDVLGKVFAAIDSTKFSDCFTLWINTFATVTKGEVVAIDGKTVRRSDDKILGKRALHIVSAYAADNRVCLGQYCVDEKSNEITAIPELLELLMVKDAVITIDAMGCQKDIAEKIITKEADYVLMVKGNQKNLMQQIEATFENAVAESSSKKHDIGHGRIETRHCQATENLSLIKNKNDWTGLKSIVKIISERIDKRSGKSSLETRYYISSLPSQADRLNDVVRNHWKIENNLHWVLDVVFKEDNSLKKKGNSALNFNIIAKIALTLIDKDSSSKKSKVVKRQSAALDDNYRANLLKI
ncbi:MAG: ISAs1 family transposase [Reichenbachiella sp.]